MLLLKNGQKVRDADTWFKQRRPEILKDYETYIYGAQPRAAGDVRAWGLPRDPACTGQGPDGLQRH